MEKQNLPTSTCFPKFINAFQTLKFHIYCQFAFTFISNTADPLHFPSNNVRRQKFCYTCVRKLTFQLFAQLYIYRRGLAENLIQMTV